jgi:hypothetical protein
MSTRILKIREMNGAEHNVGDSTDELVCVGINYKRDGSTASYKGPEGCYEVLVVTKLALAKKEEKQEKKEVPAKVLYTIPGKNVALVMHDISEEPKANKKEEKPIVLERVTS